MEDDLNTADAISALFELVKFINSNYNSENSKTLIKKTYELLLELSDILGLLQKKEETLEEEILMLIEKRNEARKSKDYSLADKIRDDLKNKGVLIEDTKDGVKWKRI